MKKILALALAMIMVFAVAGVALAQNVDSAAGGSGSITISNAAKGETYKVYKIFDATVGANGEISYTGNIPADLSAYFTKDTVGVIRAASGKSDTEIATAVADYVAALTSGEVISATSDGTALTFSNLTFGYYGVTSSQGSVVSVDSNNPTVTIIDKNSVTPSPVKKVNGKDVDDVHIGETVTYTATFGPLANFIGDEQVKSYTISDTLPEFLGSIVITEVKVWDKDPTATGATATDLSSSYSAFSNKKIVIPWVDNNDPAGSLYANKSYITIAYTAAIQSEPVINTVDGTQANINTVTITPNKDKIGDEPFSEHWDDDAEVKTYGAALRKVDGNSNPLTGAKFTIDGYEVAAVTGEPGVYKITGTKTGASAEMDTNDQGYLYILGMDDALSVTETVAPAGYNKLDAPVTLQKQLLSHTIWTASGDKYFDAKGNLVSESSSSTTTTAVSKNYTDLEATPLYVVNNSGVELPSTGGIGTTIFYVAGLVLVLGAAVILVVRRKADAE